MFIKKDLRKIEEILNDPKDERTSLKLAKRTGEFDGNISCLTRKLDALSNLTSVNLYDNSLLTLEGIGALSIAPLSELNLGCNKLTSIPLEFGKLTSLRKVWLEDNDFEEFPLSLCQLEGLECLRMSGNKLSSLPANLNSLKNLKSIYLENNSLTEFPRGLLELTALTSLWLRQNKIPSMPDDIDKLENLQVLSISSNSLKVLPESVIRIGKLTKLYANGNAIEEAPRDLSAMATLMEVNLANNRLAELPEEWLAMWGEYDRSTGKLKKEGGASDLSITLEGNPATARSKESPMK